MWIEGVTEEGSPFPIYSRCQVYPCLWRQKSENVDGRNADFRMNELEVDHQGQRMVERKGEPWFGTWISEGREKGIKKKMEVMKGRLEER